MFRSTHVGLFVCLFKFKLKLKSKQNSIWAKKKWLAGYIIKITCFHSHISTPFIEIQIELFETNEIKLFKCKCT